MKRMIMAILSLSVAVLHAQAPTQSMQFTRSARTSIFCSSEQFGQFNRSKFDMGGWFQRTGIGVHSGLWIKSNGSIGVPTPHASIFSDIGPDNRFELLLYGGPIGQTRLALFTSVLVLNDFNKHRWHVSVDTTQADQTKRIKLWIDGAEIGPNGYVQWPALNVQVYDGENMSIGGNSVIGNPGSADYYFQGYQQNCWFVSGRRVDESELVNSDGTAKDLTKLPGLISYHRGDASPIATDSASGIIWNNNGVTYGPPLP